MSNLSLPININQNIKYLTLLDCIDQIKDPRRDHSKKHPFVSVMVIAICAVIAGATGWTDIQEFALDYQDEFGNFLYLPYGIPSHDTFGRVFSLIHPIELQTALSLWMEQEVFLDVAELREHLVCDGKILRGVKSDFPLAFINVWGVRRESIIGQERIHNDANEITTLPVILNRLFLKGAIISIDAIGCQKKIARIIKRKEANYVFALKKNQHNLYEDVALYMRDYERGIFDREQHDYFKTEECVHGRYDIRECWSTSHIEWLYQRHQWAGLEKLIMVKNTRITKGHVVTSYRYYITSLNVPTEMLTRLIREHWHIENKLHWTLDTHFNEDQCTIRDRFGCQNISWLRGVAISLLRKNPLNNGVRAIKSRASRNIAINLNILCLNTL